MKLFFAAIATAFCITAPIATEAANRSNSLGIDLGLGFNSNYGLIGIGGRYFVSDNLDIHINSGIDLSGLIINAGSRYYIPSSDKSCFFVFSCEPSFFIGGTLILSNGSTISIDDNGVVGEYQQSDGYAGNISVGSYDVFWGSFTMGFEIGLRMWMKRPDIKFQSGTFSTKSQRNLERHIEDSANVAMTLGWLF